MSSRWIGAAPQGAGESPKAGDEAEAGTSQARRSPSEGSPLQEGSQLITDPRPFTRLGFFVTSDSLGQRW
jgi:hypothetical protein